MDQMPTYEPDDEYDYDLPEDDDCWHLDEPREVTIRRRPDKLESSSAAVGQIVGTYLRVGINARKADSTGAGVKVVILDNGVEHEHPSLQRNIDLDGARDFDHDFSGEGRPYQQGGRIANRYNAHGTACAGLVAAIELPGSRVVGVARKARIVPIRISTNFEVERLIAALEYARGVGQVILLPRFLPQAARLTEKIEAIAKDVTVVCAAGNDGTASLVYPAYLENVIAVGACNERGYRSTYSQYGDRLDIVAPSNDLPVEDRDLIRLDTDEVNLRVREGLERKARRNDQPLPVVDLPTLLLDPEQLPQAALAAAGLTDPGQKTVEKAPAGNLDRFGVLSIATTDNLGDFGYNFEPSGDYCKATGDFGFGGTSAAAAQVAGVVALMLSKQPGLTPRQVREKLQGTADPTCLKDRTGNTPGKPSSEFGYGLVNAEAAVA
jgi:subtilisin family serine protease